MKKSLKAYIAALFSLSLSAGLLRVLLVNRLVDETGEFPAGEALHIVYACALTVLCLFVILLPLIINYGSKGCLDLEPAEMHVFDRFAYILAAIMMLFSVYPSFKALRDGCAAENPSLSQSKVFPVLIMIFTVLSALYLIILAIVGNKPKTALALLSFAPVIRCIVSTIRLYFDTGIAIANSNKILCEIAFLFAAVYFLSEARFQLQCVKGNYFFAATGLALVLLVSSTLPGVLCKDVLAISEDMNYEYYIFQIAMILFITVRGINYTSGAQKEAVGN